MFIEITLPTKRRYGSPQTSPKSTPFPVDSHTLSSLSPEKSNRRRTTCRILCLTAADAVLCLNKGKAIVLLQLEFFPAVTLSSHLRALQTMQMIPMTRTSNLQSAGGEVNGEHRGKRKRKRRQEGIEGCAVPATGQ